MAKEGVCTPRSSWAMAWTARLQNSVVFLFRRTPIPNGALR